MPALDARLRVVTVGPGERAPYAAGIAALEKGTSYPLGADRFELDHGEDYFAFFDRLGEVIYDVALDGAKVVAISARVLRTKPFACWYLCDLKVHPDYRGQRITTRLARHAFLRAYARARRGYGISMNDGDAAGNRVARLVRRLPIVPFRVTELEIFSFEAEEMNAVREVVERHRGPTSFLSLTGMKDIVLESTGTPMPLLHVQFGPCAETGQADVAPGHVHMLCAQEGDSLSRALRASDARPSATATILHHRMKDSAFEFVLTSEI